MFSRLDYDMGSYKTDIAQSMRPLEFNLDLNKYKNNLDYSSCAPSFLGNDIGYVGFYEKSDKIDYDKRPMIDIESDLTRRDIKLSRDPRAQYLPPCCDPNSPGYPAGDGYHTTCKVNKGIPFVQDCRNYTTYPRVINPPITLKGTGVNRFEFPPLEPQEPSRWDFLYYKGTNSRNFVKDMWDHSRYKVIDPESVEGIALNEKMVASAQNQK